MLIENTELDDGFSMLEIKFDSGMIKKHWLQRLKKWQEVNEKVLA